MAGCDGGLESEMFDERCHRNQESCGSKQSCEWDFLAGVSHCFLVLVDREELFLTAQGWPCGRESFAQESVECNLLVEPSEELRVGIGCAQTFGDEGIIVLVKFRAKASQVFADLVFIHW